MGRITVFTDDDILSCRVNRVLDAMGLPYHEINLVNHPKYQKDLETLSMSSSVPQVFFNTRHIGGYKNLLKELQKWNKEADGDKKKVLERFENQVGKMPDPKGIPKVTASDIEDLQDRKNLESAQLDTLLKLQQKMLQVEWPDSNSLTNVNELTERLEMCLPKTQRFYKGSTYKNTFSGKELLETLDAVFPDIETPSSLAARLLRFELVLPISGKVSFDLAENKYYWLHCHVTPDIINSHAFATRKFLINAEPSDLHQSDVANHILTGVNRLMIVIERDCMNHKGKVDHTKTYLHASFGLLEWTFSELKAVDPKVVFPETSDQLAFCLNVYNSMLRFALLKVGIPATSKDKQHLLSHVRFNLGGSVYCFSSFLDHLLALSRKLRDPKHKVKSTKKVKDGHNEVDHRIHFAVNQGTYLGCQESLPFAQYSSGDALIDELDTTGRVLCSQPKICKVQKNEILLASFFRDHKGDFSRSEDGLVEMLAETVSARHQRKLSNAKVKGSKFVETDWTYHSTNYRAYDKALIISKFSGIQAFASRFRPPGPTRDEKVRLRTLYSLGLLDTNPEDRFDSITTKCQKEMGMPIVIVNLIDRNRQWFKSIQWTCPDLDAPSETPREVAFCGHTILTDGMLCVEDALEDDRFAENPLVTGPVNLRFYAGVPITVGGTNIGSFCVADQKPHTLSPKQKERIMEYANMAQRELMKKGNVKSLAESFLDMSMSNSMEDFSSNGDHFVEEFTKGV